MSANDLLNPTYPHHITIGIISVNLIEFELFTIEMCLPAPIMPITRVSSCKITH